MIVNEKNDFKYYIFIILAGMNFLVVAEYCKNVNDSEFTDKPVDEWKIFFQKLFSELSSYDVQQDTSKYNVQNLNDWGEKYKPQGLIITEDNFGNFSKKISESFNISIPNHKDDENSLPSYLKTLNNILSNTIHSKLSINCSEEGVTVSGHFISLKNLKNYLIEQFNTSNPACYEGKEAQKRIQSVNIFSLNTLFIDVDIYQSLLPRALKMFPLIFIAPKWEVIGKRIINLTGSDGYDINLMNQKEYKIPTYFYSYYNNRLNKSILAKKTLDLDNIYVHRNNNVHYLHDNDIIYLKENGIYYSDFDKHTSHGDPGLPGQPGGTFIGIGREFINGENLTILTSGGNGGDGKNATDGKTISSIVRIIRNFDEEPRCKRPCAVTKAKLCHRIEDPIDVTHIQHGGHGGAKGIGGPKGKFILIELVETSRTKAGIKNISEDGSYGKNGIGGLGMKRNATFKPQKYICYVDNEFVRISKLKDLERPVEGDIGLDGYVTFEDDLTDYFNISESKVYREYHNYFWREFGNSLVGSHDFEFFKNFNDLAVAKGSVNSGDLWHESRELETKYHQNSYKNEIAPYYELLLNEILAYFKNKQPSADKKELKRLKYLYAAMLSRKNYLQQNVSPGFITFVYNYFKQYHLELQENNQVQAKKQIINAVQNFNERKKEEIENAKIVTQTEIEHDLETFEESFKSEMNKVMKEIKSNQQKSEDQKRDLYQEKSGLLEKALFKSFFSGLKLANAVVACVGPMGAAVSMVSGNVINAAEALSTGGIQAGANKLKEIGGELSKGIKEISEQQEAIEKLKAEAGVNTHRYFLNTLAANGILFGSVGVNINEMSPEDLRITYENVQKEVKDNPGKFEKVKSFVTKYPSLVQQVPDTAITVILSVQEYYAESDRLEELIKQSEVVLRQFKDFEENVYPMLVKDIGNLIPLLKNFSNNIDSASKVDFNMCRKKIEDVLDKTIDKIESILNTYPQKKNLIKIVDRLKKILSYTSHSNDVIKDIEENQAVVDVLKKFSLGETDKNDEELIKLEYMIYSNILLKKYKLLYRSLEMKFFPYGSQFLRDFQLPEQLHESSKNDSSNITDALEELNSEVKDLHSRITDYKTLITHTDYITYEGYFTRTPTNSSFPFFVWKNDEHKTVISELFSGKEVQLTADVMKASSPKWEAVKMNNFTFNFVSKNNQKKLDELLRYFEIEVTHRGDNSYKLHDKIYRIKTDEISVKWTLDEVNSRPVSQTKSKIKLTDGDFLLSPYATYTVQLKPIDKTQVNFPNETNFSDSVDIELSGYGIRTDENESYKLQYDYKLLYHCDIPKMTEKIDEPVLGSWYSVLP